MNKSAVYQVIVIIDFSTLLAEIYHFQHERVIDFREMMKQFLNEQLNFYKEVRGILLGKGSLLLGKGR